MINLLYASPYILNYGYFDALGYDEAIPLIVL